MFSRESGAGESHDPLLEEGSVTSDDIACDELLREHRKRQSWWSRRSAFWKVTIICVSLALVDVCVRTALLLRSQRVHSATTYDLYNTKIGDCYCGHSIAEAKELGCVYDALAITWSPPHCYDKELTEEFNRAGPGPNGEWPYYADDEAKIPLTLEEVALLADTDRGFYTVHAWHLVHCNFSWRKLFRAQTTGVIMDKDKNSLEHIAHCGMLEGPKYHNLTLNSLATAVRNSLHGGGDI